SIADVAVIWAATEGGIRGFLVPTDTPGFTATAIEAKLSMRASIQCDITLDDVALPAEAALPEVTGLKVPFSCLNEARYGIMRSEEHTSALQSRFDLVCRLLLAKKTSSSGTP